MMTPNRLLLFVTCLTLVPELGRAQSDCFSSGSIAGAVLGTFFSTLAVAALTFLIWRTCRPRQTPGATHKSREANIEGGSGFDNPCFEDQGQTDNGDSRANQHDPENKDRAAATSWTPLRFFGASRNKKKRCLDDSFVAEPEHVSVKLRGHDFTGLGFNVVGNMRNGIYVKDILNRGPAFESGKIAPGDKILSVKISFRHMVYEDALTILSYASPYDVTLMLEKGTPKSALKVSTQRKATSSVSLAGSIPSVSMAAGVSSAEGSSTERLVHPLYRSQSINDLTRVGNADAVLKTEVKIPSLSGGFLAKSKLQGKSNLEFNVPAELKIKGELPKAQIKSGKATVSVPDVSVEKPSKGSKLGIKVLPSLNLKSTKDDSKIPILEQGSLKTSLEGPEIDLFVPKPSDVSVSIDVPDGASALPDIKIPKGEVAVELPSVKVDIPDADVKLLELKGPSVMADVLLPQVDVKYSSNAFGLGGLDLKMPKLSFKKKQKGDANVGVKMEVPKVDVSSTGADFDASLPKLTTDHEASVKIPKLNPGKLDISAKLPEASLQVDVPAISADIAHGETEEASGKSKSKFGFKMPKWQSSKPQVTVNMDAPTITAEGELPDVNIKAKSIKTDVNIPQPDLPAMKLNVESGDNENNFGIDLPKFKVPKPEIGIELPKVDIKGSKLEAGLQLEGGDLGINEKIGGSIHLPEVALKGTEAKVNAELDLPAALKLELPEAKAEMALPTVEISRPDLEMNLGASANVPGVEVDFDKKDFDKKKMKFGIKLPEFHLGKPHASGQAEGGVDVEIEAPRLEIDADSDSKSNKKKGKLGFHMPKLHLGKGEVDIDKPDVKASGGAPGVEIDTEREGKFNVKLPKLGVEKPEIDVDVPDISGEVSLGLPGLEVKGKHETEESNDEDESKKKAKFGVKLPKLNVDKPKLDLEPGAIEISAKVPSIHAKIGLEDAQADGSKKKSKFSIKMPKFGADKPHVEVDTTGIDVDASVDLPSMKIKGKNSESDADGNGKKKGKFGMKFPKFGMDKPHIEAEAGGLDAGVSVELPSLDVKVKGDHTESDDESNRAKKKGKFGIKFPKFGMDKPHIEGEAGGLEAGISVEVPSVDVKVKGDHTESDDESNGGKKKGKFGMKFPKFGTEKPNSEVEAGGLDAGVSVELPNVDVKVQTDHTDSDDESSGNKKKGKFGMKFPKFGVDKPNFEAEAGGLEAGVSVDVPSVDVKIKGDHAESDDESSGTKKKGKFGMKFPKFGTDKPHIEGEAGGLEAGVSVDLPSVDVKVKSDHTESDDESSGAKKKGKFGMKFPKFGIDKPHTEGNVTGLETGVSVNLPSTNVKLKGDHTESDDDSNGGIKKGKLGMKFPKFGMDKPHIEGEAPGLEAGVSVELPTLDVKVKGDHTESDDESSGTKKKGKFGMKFPKFGMDKSHVEGEAGGLEAGVSVDVPSVDVKIKTDHAESDDDSNGTKKKGKFGMKFPKFGVDKPHIEAEAGGLDAGVAVELPSLDVRVKGGHTESDDESNGAKKKGKFGMKFPKFGMEKPHIEGEAPGLETGVSVDFPSVDVKIRADHADSDDESSGTKKKGKFGMKFPKFGMDKSHIEGDARGLEAGVSVDIPSVGVKVRGNHTESDDESNGGKKKGKFGMKFPKFGLDKPHIEAEAGGLETGISVELPSLDVKVKDDHAESDDDSNGGKKKGKFGMKFPKFGLDKPHIEAEAGELEAGVSVDLPSIDVKVKGDHTESDDESNGGKRRGKFGVKFPKFGLDKPHIEGDAAGLEAGVSVDLPGLDVKVKGDYIDSDDESSGTKKKGKFEMKFSKFGVDKPHFETEAEGLEGGVSVDLPSVDVKLKGDHAESDDDSSGTKKKGKFGMKFPKFGIDKPHIEGEAPGLDAGVSVNLPSVDVKVRTDHSESDDESNGAKKKGKFGMKFPKFGMDKPHIEGGTSGLEAGVSLDIPSVDVKVKADHADSDDENNGTKKKGKFGMKFPKFGMDKPHIEAGAGDLDAAVSVGVPSIDVKVNADHADSDDENNGTKKKGKFGMKFPKFGMDKPHVEGDAAGLEAGVSVDVPSIDVKVKTCHTESDDETAGTKKKSKFGVKLPKFGTHKPHFETEAGELETALAVNLPSVDVKAKTDNSDSEDDTSGTKKSSKFGIKMPKFGAEKPHIDLHGREMEVGASVELPVPEVKAQASEVDIDAGEKKKTKFGIKMPKFGIDKPQLDLEPIGIEAEAHLPKVNTKASHEESGSDEDSDEATKLKTGIKFPKMKLGKPQLEAAIDVPDVDVKVKQEDSDSDEEVYSEKKKKNKGSFGIKLPTLDIHMPKIQGGAEADLRASAEIPKVEVDIHGEADAEESKKKSKFGISLPKFSKVSGNLGGDSNLEAGIEITRPELEFEKPKLSGELDAGAVGVEIKPELDLGLGIEVDQDEDMKKKSFGLKMSKLKVGQPHGDIEIKGPSVTGPEIEVDIGHDSDSDETKDKKKYKFGLKMPKFQIGKPEFSVQGGSSKDLHLEAEVQPPSLDIEHESNGEVSETKKKGKFNLKMSKPKIQKPEIDLEINTPKSTGISVDVQPLTIETSVSQDDEDSEEHEKKKGKFSFKMPKLHFSKGHGEADLELGAAKDLNQEASAELPQVDVKLEHDHDSDDEKLEGKKKKRFGLKMPKFTGSKHSIEVGVPASKDIEVGISAPEVEIDASKSLDVKLELPEVSLPSESLDVSLEADAKLKEAAEAVTKEGKKKGKFSFKMPKFHTGSKAHAEIEVPTVDEDVAIKSAIDLPRLDVKVNKPNVEAEIEVPTAAGINIELPSVGLPKLELEVKNQTEEADESEDKEKKKSKFALKMPKFHSNKPHGEVEIGIAKDLKLEGKIEAPELELDDKESGKGEKKKSKFGLKMPDFQLRKPEINVELEAPEIVGPKVELDIPKAKIDLPKLDVNLGGTPDLTFSADTPKLETTASMQLSGAKIEFAPPSAEVDVDAAISAAKTKGKFALKMPEFQVSKGIPDVDLAGEGNLTLEANLPGIDTGKSIGVEVPEVDISTPTLGIDVALGNLQVQVPEVDATIKVDKKVPKFGIKLPSIAVPELKATIPDNSASLNISADAGIDPTSINIGMPNVKVDVSEPAIEVPEQTGIEVSAELPSSDVTVGGNSLEHGLGVTVSSPSLELLPDSDSLEVRVDPPQFEVPAIDLKLSAPKLEAEINPQLKQNIKIDEASPKGFSFGLKMPKFKSVKDKPEIETSEVEMDVEAPGLTVEPSAVSEKEKEKKKFSIGLKMPKLHLSKAQAGIEAETEEPEVSIRNDELKAEVTGLEDENLKREAQLKSKLVDVDVKLPRVSLKAGDHHEDVQQDSSDSETSEDEEKTSKEIKKNIGARFGVKLKKPKLFASNKAEISKEKDSSSTLAGEWKLPRVDLRKNVKLDEELVIATNVDYDPSEHLDQLSPSERAEALRRDSKVSSGIRIPTTTTSVTLSSPRAKAKASLPHLEIESSPRLLSVTRLDPTPPVEGSPLKAVDIAADQVSVNDVPASLIMASDAVKLRRGPPVPAKRTSITSLVTTVSSVATTEVSAEITSASGIIESETSSARLEEETSTLTVSTSRVQVSDTNIHISTSVASSDVLVIQAGPEGAPGRKAASLGDLTRIGPVIAEDGTLERTVSLDLNPISSGGSSSSASRAIHNLAVQDLSRVGEDSDEELVITRKRSAHVSDVSLEIITDTSFVPTPTKRGMNRTLLAVNTDGTDVNIRPLDASSAEALWFGSSSTEIRSMESVQHLEVAETDVTLTASLGSSPSDTESSASSPSPAQTPDLADSSNMATTIEMETTNGTQYHREIIEITREELETINFAPISPVSASIRRFSTELGGSHEMVQVMPRTELNPSADTFAAVRSRFEQLTQNNRDTNGAEVSPTRVSTATQNRSPAKRFSGTYEEISGGSPNTIVQKSVMHIAPEVSEGALSRTVIISSLQLERTTLESQTPNPMLGPESPVPNLEPPC